MQMEKCPNGHFYDASKHQQCPYCKGLGNVVGVTVPVERPHRIETNPNATVAVIQKQLGIDPVVGWLVCVEGVEKGRDYRLHTDNNYIGRDPSMDVCISGAETISRARHAVITYDFESKTFYLTPKDGRSNPCLNGKPVMTMVELKANDRIRLGQTTLLFFPLCSDAFDWR